MRKKVPRAWSVRLVAGFDIEIAAEPPATRPGVTRASGDRRNFCIYVPGIDGTDPIVINLTVHDEYLMRKLRLAGAGIVEPGFQWLHFARQEKLSGNGRRDRLDNVAVPDRF